MVEACKALASMVSVVVGWPCGVVIVVAGCATFLIYTDKITLAELKDFFKRDKKIKW